MFTRAGGGVGVGAVLQKAKVQTVLSTSQLDASGANQRDAAAAVSTSCINFSPQIQPASPDTTTQIQQPSPILSPDKTTLPIQQTANDTTTLSHSLS